WGGSTITLLLLILFIGGTILQNKLPDILKNRVYSSSDSLYRIDFNDMDVSLLTGSVRLSQIRLVPDTSVYRALEESEAPASLIGLKSSSVRLSGVNILKLIFSKDLSASNLTIDQPEIVLMNM